MNRQAKKYLFDIVHDYAKVVDAVVWEIVHSHLPLLKIEAATLLNESN